MGGRRSTGRYSGCAARASINSYLRILVIVFALSVVLSGCGGATGGGNPSSVTTNPSGAVAVSVSPASTTVGLGSAQQFAAVVTGTTNTAVSWSVNGFAGGSTTLGTISSAGLYSAPSAMPNSATITVTATSAADATKSASASIILSNSFAGLDVYGGCTNCSLTGLVTGYFHTEKINSRWWFIDPLGNPYWMRAVQNTSDTSLHSKYPTWDSWSAQTRSRLQNWGFNAFSEYSSMFLMSRGLPTAQMPFVWLFTPSCSAELNTGSFASEGVKDILAGVNTSTYSGYRTACGLVDAYDPKFATYAQSFFNSSYQVQSIPGGATNPWLLGYAADDGDNWFGVSQGTAMGGKPHPGWMVLVSAPTQASNSRLGQSSYTDTTLYSKSLGLRDFLKTRYSNNISALNTAWGSSYTSWDSAGGYGTGTGLLDENGSHAWVPQGISGAVSLTGATAAMQKDLDDFLTSFTDRLSQVAVQAIRSGDKNHLIFSPDTVNANGFMTRPQALQAMAKWFDVLIVNYVPDFTGQYPQRATMLQSTYDITGKPMYSWLGITANADSGMSAYTNTEINTGVEYTTTQTLRGSKYQADVQTLLNAKGTNGDYAVIGLDWWSWMDKASEGLNWGLVSGKDNAYDGVEAVTATVQCSAPNQAFACGGEAATYGDFLTLVRTTNRDVYCTITSAPCPP